MVLIGVKKDDTAGYAPGKALLFERSFFFISEMRKDFIDPTSVFVAGLAGY